MSSNSCITYAVKHCHCAVCKPTRSDGSELPPDWDGLDLSSSTLHAVVWERIVIDEAHKIKGRTTNVAKAIYALRAEHRWCLSGTPLQNNVRHLRILSATVWS